MRGGKQGPAKLTVTKGYNTTQTLSVLNKLLAANMLRRGDGLYSTPASRRKERLFGVTGAGRTSARRMGVKLERLGADYEPRLDTCLKAYVRLLAVRAEAAAAEEVDNGPSDRTRKSSVFLLHVLCNRRYVSCV